MEYKHLKNIAQITMGQSPKSETYNNKKEGLPFFQGNADFGEISPKVRIWCSVPKKVAHKNDILISVRAPIGALNIADTECCIGRGLAAISVRNIKDRDYIFNALKAKSEYLKNRGTGSTFKAINKNILEDVEIPIVSTEKRDIEIKVLNKLNIVKKQKEKELSKLDTLIKARYVEMFGDPIINTKDLSLVSLGKLCTLKAGEFTAAKEIHANKDNINRYPCFGGNGVRGYVDNYTHDGNYSLIGRQGALCGNVQLTAGKFRNTEHAILVKPNVQVNYYWLFMLLKLEKLNRFSSGAAQPGLAVKTLNKIFIPIADLNLQNEFASFAQQVDKSKVVNNLIMKYIISIDFICSLI